MRCPRCGQELEVERHHGVDVHECGSCRGMFLAQGELNKVAEPTSGDLEFSSVDLDSFQHADVRGPVACPQCGTAMKKVEFNIHTNILLDYCERCRGFWLDGEELDRINEEVRELNDAAGELPGPPMLWFAHFVWSLPH